MTPNNEPGQALLCADHYLHCVKPKIMRVEAKEHLPTGSTAEELDNQVLVDKHAAFDLIYPQDRRLPDGYRKCGKVSGGIVMQ